MLGPQGHSCLVTLCEVSAFSKCKGCMHVPDVSDRSCSLRVLQDPHGGADHCPQPRASFRIQPKKYGHRLCCWGSSLHPRVGRRSLAPWDLLVYSHTVKTSELGYLSKNTAYFGAASQNPSHFFPFFFF